MSLPFISASSEGLLSRRIAKSCRDAVGPARRPALLFLLELVGFLLRALGGFGTLPLRGAEPVLLERVLHLPFGLERARLAERLAGVELLLELRVLADRLRLLPRLVRRRE